jgi:hypothetical protein
MKLCRSWRSRKILTCVSLLLILTLIIYFRRPADEEEDPTGKWTSYLKRALANERGISKYVQHTDENLADSFTADSLSNETTSNNREYNTKLIHVSYVHYFDTKDKPTEDNFKFFMHFAYVPCDPRVFFTIIFNKKDVTKSPRYYLENLLGDKLYRKVRDCLFNTKNKLSSKFKRNTQIIMRSNRPGGDLCAQVDFLKSDFWSRNEKIFKYFFFINSSVRGPFLPTYYLKKW